MSFEVFCKHLAKSLELCVGHLALHIATLEMLRELLRKIEFLVIHLIVIVVEVPRYRAGKVAYGLTVKVMLRTSTSSSP